MILIKSVRNLVIVMVVSLFAAALLFWRTVTPSFAEEPNTIYLPLISRNFSQPTVFGAESFRFTDPEIIQLAVDAKISWIRIPAFDWSKIEATKGEYEWDQVPNSSLKNISDNNMYAIATVKMTPWWAQKYPGNDPSEGVYCGPIAQDSFDDFAAFMQEAVGIYSEPPYNIHHWEFGNEPDVDHDLVPANSVFGCWGDSDDPYYGGGYYAEMLKVVYPAIKAVDPQAQILIGGLLLDCDPVDPQCVHTTPPKFFEGILRNGGGAYFDMVSFHGYPYFDNGLIYDENFGTWDQRGGVVLGKAAFLREVMARYGVDKPLFHTEGALLCPTWNEENCDPEPDAIYEDAKAEYIVWLFVRALANDFEGSIWYTLDGGAWRGGELIGDSKDPNPAYHAFKVVTEKLAYAKYSGQPLGTGGDLRVYSFNVPGKNVWIVWSIDDLSHNLTLPTGYTNVYDKFGNPVTVSGGVLAVKSPVYIELP